jgi:putative oxidoreductase
MRSLLATSGRWEVAVLRVAVGGVVLIHGLTKVLPGGLFGVGGGFPPFARYMSESHGMPAWVSAGVVAVETAGCVCLVVGLGTRVVAALLVALFVGIVATVHWQHGFFINWLATLPAGAEGFEMHILVLAMCAALVGMGGGRWSLDGWLARR